MSQNIAKEILRTEEKPVKILGDSTDFKPNSISIFGVNIWNGTMAKAIDWVVKRVNKGSNTRIGFVNANNLNISYLDNQLKQHFTSCDRVFADGSGVKLASRILNSQSSVIKHNVNGTDMFPLLCTALEEKGKRIYLLGAAKGVARRVKINLSQTNPELVVCGYHDGYLADELNNRRVIKDINASNASILLVAMGTPLQEMWLDNNESKINVPVKMCVGGLFDFFANRVSRAPLWMRDSGLEWVWRLVQEPRRMWRRYVLGNPLFILRVMKEYFVRSVLDFRFLRRGKTDSCILNGKLAKRSFDIVVASLGLVLLSPLLLLISLFIVFESVGNPLYCQQRIGRDGMRFKFWKFRSMVKDAHAMKRDILGYNDSAGGVLFKLRQDPRITNVGQYIRRYSLDELPQLWNVLLGDMSLVGPRPALPEEVSRYSDKDKERLKVLPGITCYWQISGRSDLSFNQQIELDIKYLKNQSFLIDLRILLKTLPAVMSGKGAY